jgi:hypothetical protein
MEDQTKGDGPAKQPSGDQPLPAGNSVAGISHTESTQNAQSGCRADLEHKHNSSKSMTPFEFVSLIVSGFTLILVGVTATVYYYQLQEMQKANAVTFKALEVANKSVGVASDTAYRQLRAYVGLQLIYIEQPGATPSSGKYGRIVVKLKNFGQTPAHDATTIFSYIDAAIPNGRTAAQLPKDYDFNQASRPIEGGPASLDYIEPGRELMSFGLLDDKSKFFDEEFLKKRSLFVYGTISYVDVYNIKHARDFCYLYSRSFDPTINLAVTEIHNGEREIK